MAKFYKLLAISCWLLVASCQEGGEAGDLFGQWRMDGSESKYISFSGAVTWLQDLEVGEIYGNFQHQGDSSSLARDFSPREMSETSCCRLSLLDPLPLINWI